MTKEYVFSDRTQLSPHFNVSEFKCKCGNNHNTVLDDTLVQKLEQLYAKLNCSKIIVTSGYRCETHDRSVGGNGSGQHTKGTAADICCYGQDGNPICSKQVCIAAQDLGFGGIANITSEYIYTHVDVRNTNIWYGDETVSNNTVTNDFRTYFGIAENVKYGVDVSVHNGIIDWSQANVDFVIIRAGYGCYTNQVDSQFENNYINAKANGKKVGVYWYSYAVTPAEAVQEAEACLSIISGKQFDLPVFFDLEESSAFETGKENCSAMFKAFSDRVQSAGYQVGLYISRSPLQSFITDAITDNYPLWVAEYNERLNYNKPVAIWQKSCTGNIAGINGCVDLDELYVAYINNAPAPVVEPEPEPTPQPETPKEKIAIAVIVDGKKYCGELNRMD